MYPWLIIKIYRVISYKIRLFQWIKYNSPLRFQELIGDWKWIDRTKYWMNHHLTKMKVLAYFFIICIVLQAFNNKN